MITLVPADWPVTTPVLLTVATPGVAETHALLDAAVPEPVSCVVELTQVDNVPLIVGNALIVTVTV